MTDTLDDRDELRRVEGGEVFPRESIQGHRIRLKPAVTGPAHPVLGSDGRNILTRSQVDDRFRMTLSRRLPAAGQLNAPQQVDPLARRQLAHGGAG